MSSDISPGDWVTITARIQVHKIEHLRAPYPDGPTGNAFTSIEYISGQQDMPGWDGGDNTGWDGTSPAIFTIELPRNPADGLAINLEKDN